MTEVPQKRSFLMCSFHNLLRKVKQFVWKYYLDSWLIGLANKLNDIGKFLISFYVMCYYLKSFLFYWENMSTNFSNKIQ